jgi:DNA-binding CsgD family transcriptional regulator
VDRATALLMLGDPRGWAEADELPSDPPDARGRLQVTVGNLNVGDQAMLWGRYADAQRRLDLALSLAETHQYLHVLDLILATRLHLDWFTGAWDGLAKRLASLPDDDDVQSGARFEANLVMGLLEAATGAAETAELRLLRAHRETRRHGAMQLFMEPAGALARLWLGAGRVQEALRVTEEAADVVVGKQIWTWATEIAPVRVSALAAAGRVGEATDLVEAFAAGLQGRDAPAPEASLELCRASLAQVKGEPTRAADLFAQTAAAWAGLPRPYEALLARERQAHCLLITDQHEEGLAVLTETLSGLSTLGAATDASRVTAALRAHGVQTRHVWRGGTRGYGAQLSPRELEVVRLIVAGHTTREAAAALSRSPNTVGKQLKSAMGKLQVSSLATLAVRALESGISDTDDRARA